MNLYILLYVSENCKSGFEQNNLKCFFTVRMNNFNIGSLEVHMLEFITVEKYIP